MITRDLTEFFVEDYFAKETNALANKQIRQCLMWDREFATLYTHIQPKLNEKTCPIIKKIYLAMENFFEKYISGKDAVEIPDFSIKDELLELITQFRKQKSVTVIAFSFFKPNSTFAIAPEIKFCNRAIAMLNFIHSTELKKLPKVIWKEDFSQLTSISNVPYLNLL